MQGFVCLCDDDNDNDSDDDTQTTHTRLSRVDGDGLLQYKVPGSCLVELGGVGCRGFWRVPCTCVDPT